MLLGDDPIRWEANDDNQRRKQTSGPAFLSSRPEVETLYQFPNRMSFGDLREDTNELAERVLVGNSRFSNSKLR